MKSPYYSQNNRLQLLVSNANNEEQFSALTHM